MNKNDDEISKREADLADIESGRIKDMEHLRAVDTLIEKCGDVADTLNYVAWGSQEVLYSFVNALTMEEIDKVFIRMDEFKDYFESFIPEVDE